MQGCHMARKTGTDPVFQESHSHTGKSDRGSCPGCCGRELWHEIMNYSMKGNRRNEGSMRLTENSVKILLEKMVMFNMPNLEAEKE